MRRACFNVLDELTQEKKYTMKEEFIARSPRTYRKNPSSYGWGVLYEGSTCDDVQEEERLGSVWYFKLWDQ